eukprot:scaffold647960_cov46-Prasinocladus_malaysianus.AAC.1
MNEKLEDFADNARKFTMDGGMIYDYKVEFAASSNECLHPFDPICNDQEEDPKADMEALNLKAIMSNNWVDPPKRERKRVHNYSEQEYYRQVLSSLTESALRSYCFRWEA